MPHRDINCANGTVGFHEMTEQSGMLEMPEEAKPFSMQDMFYREREPNETNLVELLSGCITTLVGDESALVFLVAMEAENIFDLNPFSQRVIINRFLTRRMHMYSALHEVNVNEVLEYIINDGTEDDWYELMTSIVLPYIKQENLLVLTNGFN